MRAVTDRAYNQSGGAIRWRAIGKPLWHCGSFGNGEEKSTPVSRGALDPNATAVSLHDTLCNSEPESSPLTASPGCLPEVVKDALQVFGRDARSCVRNPENDSIIF